MPVLIGILTVLLNLGFGLLLIRYQVVGLALTLSISSSLQYAAFAGWAFGREGNESFKSHLSKPFLAHLGIAALACLVGLLFSRFGSFEQGFTIKNALVL